MFKWTIFLVISVVIFVLGIAFAVLTAKRAQRKRVYIQSFHVVFIAAFLSLTVLFYPVFFEIHKEKDVGGLVSLFVAMQSTLQVFSINADFSIMADGLAGEMGLAAGVYSLFASFLYVLAPILTFGFILSFFQNLSSYRRYLLGFKKDVFVFSRLTNRSLSLARSERQKYGRRFTLIFTDISPSNDDISSELLEEARLLGAVFFRKDILAVRFDWHSRNAEMNFFVMGSDESEKMGQVLELHRRFEKRPRTNLYFFSSEKGSELLLAGKRGSIKLRRVDEIRTLVYKTLDEYGTMLFDQAVETAGERKITAAILGLGQYGSEMLKALTWFSQMDGYRIEIHAFDESRAPEASLRMSCPELLDETHNGVDIPGEAQYDIHFHSGVDIASLDLVEVLETLKKVTYVFVALGSDELNIETAVNLRIWVKRFGCEPLIHAVVHSSEKQKSLVGLRNAKDEEYGIAFIGDMSTIYSDAAVINSELENRALQRHMKWGDEEAFWAFEYNYRSSMASIIHKKMREHCRIPGEKKAQEERTPAEHEAYRMLEHRRWNAYVRSEGWMYSGSVERSSRCDLTKTHNLLVPFGSLPEEERVKDDD